MEENREGMGEVREVFVNLDFCWIALYECAFTNYYDIRLSC